MLTTSTLALRIHVDKHVNKHVDKFFVGKSGGFQKKVVSLQREMKKQGRNITQKQVCNTKEKPVGNVKQGNRLAA
jgi:hypothetical protein